ncbi:HSP20-like chaperone [Armillaria novae-zelandiae]|uniref:HSP20-like chaperone n=1 Tax=Armillaria novae-zelandiae TaxID=153914 RepID=A0AA39NNB5_9AGAR|nr:HSP20-like chaperone [Armillaria novae-zelandiae]
MSHPTSVFAPGPTFQAGPFTDTSFKTSHTLKFGYTELKCVVPFHFDSSPSHLPLLRMDLYEDPGTDTVTALIELPGLAKEDVHVHWNGEQITIGAEIPERDTGGHTICERTVGKLRRRVTTPRGIKEEDIEASLKNGLLTLSFPRTPMLMEKRIVVL